ncbi:MAG: CRTAC1 family protein, partial [Planctomycetota bacterium]
DVTTAAGLVDDLVASTTEHRGGACAGDVNGDGWLDLVTGVWSGNARLLINDGDGTFTDESASSGLGAVVSYYWQPVMHDFTRDGLLDIYDALDFQPNRFWVNQGGGTFLDVSANAGTANAWNDMGVALGDYDNDGDMDFYVTNITNSVRHNVLFRNDTVKGALAFAEVSDASGVAPGGWGWGATFLDADNDGDLDLAATNGWFSGNAVHDQSVFFLNQGGLPVSFTEVSSFVGFNDTLWGSGLIAFDADRDGDLDIVQTCNGSENPNPSVLRVLDNQPATQGGAAGVDNHWLLVRPRMPGPNHRAIGAVVRLSANGLELMRPITAGTSHCSQEPAEAFFGLGSATSVDQLTVEWPGGGTTVLTGIDADQIITVPSSHPADVDLDGTVGVGDLLAVILTWGPCGNTTVGCPEDIDRSGTIDTDDLLAVVLNWSS